jgi:hypothetical protein
VRRWEVNYPAMLRKGFLLKGNTLAVPQADIYPIKMKICSQKTCTRINIGMFIQIVYD